MTAGKAFHPGGFFYSPQPAAYLCYMPSIRAIQSVTKTGAITNFSGITEASRTLKISFSTIRNALRSGQSVQGLRFQYLPDCELVQKTDHEIDEIVARVFAAGRRKKKI